MSYDDYDDDDTFESENDNPIRDLRKQNRTKDRQIKELQEQLAVLQKTQRERSVADVLTSKGLNPKIARFVPNEITSEEEVAQWIEEFADVFGGASSAQAEQPANTDVSPDARAMQEISQVQSQGEPFSNDPNQLTALIAGARTPEELNKVLFGNAVGPVAY